MGFRKKGQILRGRIQFIVNELICPGNVVHQWRAADFAWLFFHYGSVIGVEIVDVCVVEVGVVLVWQLLVWVTIMKY